MLSSYVHHQRACAKTLVEILDRVAAYERATGLDLPSLAWTIGFEGMSAVIDSLATIALFGPRPTQREVFDRWVKAIGAEPVANKPTDDGRRFLSAVLRINGTVAVLRTTIDEEGQQA